MQPASSLPPCIPASRSKQEEKTPSAARVRMTPTALGFVGNTKTQEHVQLAAARCQNLQKRKKSLRSVASRLCVITSLQYPSIHAQGIPLEIGFGSLTTVSAHWLHYIKTNRHLHAANKKKHLAGGCRALTAHQPAFARRSTRVRHSRAALLNMSLPAGF